VYRPFELTGGSRTLDEEGGYAERFEPVSTGS
jgi:hypothetical protein